MDSIGRIVSSMRMAAENAGVPLPTDQATCDIIGLSIDNAVKALFPNVGVTTQSKLISGYRHAYMEKDTTPAELFLGTKSLLSRLKRQGFQLAVATGKTRSGLECVLQETSSHHFFDATVAGDEHQSKPHPSMLQHLLTSLGVHANQAIMVGDSKMDIEMAHAAGVDSVAVGCGAQSLQQLNRHKPTYAIAHTCDLFELLKLHQGCQA